MATDDVELDIATHIADNLTIPGGEAALPASWTLGDNVRQGAVAIPSTSQTVPGAVPVTCIFVQESPGFDDEPQKNDATAVPNPDDWPTVLRPSVQVTLRVQRGSYTAGRAQALALVSVLDKRPPSGYFDARVTGRRANHIPPEPDDHEEWTVNVNYRRRAGS